MPSHILTPENMANFDIFTLFKPIAGIYLLLWCGILGKGKLLQNKHIKVKREVFTRNMRLICGASGALLILSGIIDILSDIMPGAFLDPSSVVAWIIWGLGLAALIGIMVYSIITTDRESLRKAQEEETRKAAAEARGRSRMPSSAFDFDKEDK